MTIRKGEQGKRIYVITSFNMSSNTSLTIQAVPPSGESNEKTWVATIGGALTNITLEDGTSVASVAADESMFYDLAATTDLDEASTGIGTDDQVDWTLVGIYINTSATPDDKLISDPVTLVVLDDNIT